MEKNDETGCGDGEDGGAAAVFWVFFLRLLFFMAYLYRNKLVDNVQ